MNFRLFSKIHNLYTNSPSWPSNQRTWSEFALSPSGGILEIIHFDADNSSVQVCDSKNYIVEAWTGFFDSAGKKIYRGDTLEMKSVYDFKSEVQWRHGAFWLIPKDEHGYVSELKRTESAKNWTISGNIHGVEYSD